jgi:LAO/AO transport system kinase
VQAIKAGILEIADVFVVNKADRDGADATVKQLRAMLHLGEAAQDGWTPPVLKAVAMRGEGIAEVVDQTERHLRHLRESGRLVERVQARAAAELRQAIQEAALEYARARAAGSAWDALAARIAAREIDPYTAAAQLLTNM